MISHSVPFFSQYRDLNDSLWQGRSCGIASLKMVMEYWLAHNQLSINPSMAALLEAGQELGAYIDGIGWSHSGLVKIARQFGYSGHNVDLAPDPASLNDKWGQLLKDLKQYPVIASVYPDFDPNRKGGHLIVIRGFNKNKVQISDPLEHDSTNGEKELNLDLFLRGWKQRYIIIHPTDYKLKNIKFDFYKNYLSAINGSVNSKMFRHLYLKIDGQEIDAAKDGQLSCAIFISWMLKIFNSKQQNIHLLNEARANTVKLTADLTSCGWYEIQENQIKAGAIIIWERKEQKRAEVPHCGFYIGNGQVISHRDYVEAPVVHPLHNDPHWGDRKVETIFWHDRLDE